MTEKIKSQKAQRLMCLTFLLLEDLDDIKVNTPKMLKYKEDLINFAEEMSKEIANTNAIQKTTYFSEISNKFNTILRKNFQDI